MGVLLGQRKGAIETSFGIAHLCEWDDDIKVLHPNDCLVDGIPFAAFHPTGEELEEHKREALRRLTPVAEP
jgi:hypothetical protein